MFPKETRILLIDDMKGVRVLISKMLKEIGYEYIQEANNGKEAFDILKNNFGKPEAIGLVIADLRMPVMDGMELLRTVKESDEFKELPFVILTAESDKTNVLAAVKLGVSDYLIKPTTPIMLSKKLESIWWNLQKIKIA